MRTSVVILGFLATLTFALPEARPDAAISCQSDVAARGLLAHPM
ncbi:hypothetical protein N7541_009982, partial [Penicillium brevicompactum]